MGLPDFVRIAHEEVGNGPSKYREMFNDSSSAWCAMFVSWCAANAGIMTTLDIAGCPSVYKTDKVSCMRDFYEDNNRFTVPSLDPNDENYPRAGDIMFSLEDGLSHVGIIVEVGTNYIKTVEGNVTMPNGQNGVAYETYDATFHNGPSYKLSHIGSNRRTFG